MKQLRFLTAALGAAMALSACETPRTTSGRQESGAVIGGVLGGVLGSEMGDGSGAGTLLGVIAGALIGSAIGRSMDESDRRYVARSLESDRTGASTQWVNPDTGYSYRVIPNRTYRSASSPCREYTVEAVIRGRKELVTGTACRQPNGDWRVAD